MSAADASTDAAARDADRRAALDRAAAAQGGPGHGRIDAIDLARGFAVCLMILSHGINGLIQFEDFTSWGWVPIHAVTKFASSLFVMVFGIALAVVFVPKTDTPDWPRRRNTLLLRGLLVLFWYKVLTVVEMYHLWEPQDIIDTLLYRDFPSYVEILGFYAIALLWIPFLLPLWARTPALLRWASPVLMGLLSWYLLENFDFWGVEQLQALVVEHPDYYTWGQLARGPLVLLGLLIGGLMLRYYHQTRTRMLLAGAIAAAALLLLAAFFAMAGDQLPEVMDGIARNQGKHPPELMFMLYSMGGALGLLALALFGGHWLAKALYYPVTLIGTNALQAFVFHIVVLFVLFRHLLGYFHTISYEYALFLTLLLIGATALWIRLLQWVQVQRRS